MIRKLLRGNILAFTGLFFGLMTGAMLVLAKQWLVTEIVTALEEEVTASCDCTLAFDSLSLSFSTLRAQARNVRIVENGLPRLSFKSITANVDISEIRDKKVHLSGLTLSDGTADGVGPKSVTFRFIDQLTTPLPPEKQRPDRWRVILDRLEVEKSFLRESFGASEISGSDVSLIVQREGDNFILLPRIGDFRYTAYSTKPGELPRELLLGPLSASISIEDTQTIFRSLRLQRASSLVEINGAARDDAELSFSGNGSFSISSDYIGLPTWLLGVFSGQTAIAGTLGSPILSGTLTNASGHSLTLALPHASPVILPDLSANLSIDVNRGDPIVSLSTIKATSSQTLLASTRPLTLSGEGLTAGFKISLPDFSYGPFSLASAVAEISVSEDGAGIVTVIDALAEDLRMQGFSLGPSRIQVRVTANGADISVQTTNRAQGSLQWKGIVDLSAPQASLTSSSLILDSYRYPLVLPISKDKLAPIAITAESNLRGPLDLGSLIGDGTLSISFPTLQPDYIFAGNVTLRNGLLKVDLPNSPYKGGVDITVDFIKNFEGKLNFSQPTIPLKDLLGHQDECSRIGGSLAYNFPLNRILGGSGEIVMGSLSVGCSPYSLSLPTNSRLPVKSGAVQLQGVVLSTVDSALELNGEVSIARGFAMSAKGRLELSSLLPLLPSIDDLRGMLKTDISIRGPISEPSVVGNVELSNGQFGVTTPELEGHHISGVFSLAGKEVHIKRLSGAVNGGTFSTSGTLLPFDPNRSSLKTELREVTIEPLEDTTITFHGDLSLASGRNKQQLLSGNVNITFAEVAKDFDVNKIIMNTISGYFLPSRVRPASAKQPIDIDMDVTISAPRNIFIVTPFLSAELNANLLARGSLSDPSLEGTMQILSGWIGLKGNRFDITSGGLTFKQTSLIPHLEIVGEGNLRAPTGESVLVILDANGPLSSPKFSLNSDRGLSQSELLLILTSSRPLGESRTKGRMDSQFGSDQRFFMSDTSFSSFRAFFRSLTRLDILSFEPAYNQFTGTIEPAVVARKNLTPRLTLVGESLFSSVSNSRAGGVYALTPYLDINAFFQTVSTQKNSILSSDLTYTIWSEESQFVSISVEGVTNFSEAAILRAARLGPSSRIATTPESLQLIRNQILSYLKENAFLAATVEVSCIAGDAFCQNLRITIDEGAPSVISAITFEGDMLSQELRDKTLSIAQLHSPATASTLAAVEQALVLSLRNDGYIAARISPSFRHNLGVATSTLVVTCELRRPISFIFSGNKIFSDEDFLNSINLFSRKRPFGNNTITLLMQNIERMYHEEGFLFANVSYSEDLSDPSRIVYRIAVQEEAPIKVRSVSLIGNEKLSRNKLIEAMNAMGMKDQVSELEPEFAVPARLEALQDSIISAYHHEGFPDVSVSYSIRQGERPHIVDIEFEITEGETRLSHVSEVVGLPRELSLPAVPSGPLSLPRINIYTDDLIESLKGEGYLSPTVFTEPSSDYASIGITVEPGARTLISTISYEGLIAIPESTALRATRLQPGAPYRLVDANATKKELLRSGLFSRVEILASDGAFDSQHEAISIRLVERPLQTLELGLGANSEFGLHTFGEATNKSLFADGRTLSLRVDTYFDQAQINPSGSGLISQGFTSLRYVDPSFLGSDYSLNEEVRYQRQELSTQEFNIDRLLVGSYLFKQLRSDTAMSIGHSLVFDNLQDVASGAILSDLDDGSVRLSFLSAVFKYDKRDDPLLPKSGHTLTLEPKIAFNDIGSQANFASLIARTTAIVPLAGPASRYSLGLGLSGALAQPWGSTEDIPITQRFYLGGRTTVRGFRENSLGPRGADGAVIGGDSMIAGKAQFQYLADDSVSTHLFFDAGNVFLRHEEFNLSDLRTSIGVGFQYLSPIGPIGFDIGRPLDEQSGEPSVRIHFSVGSTF